MSGDLVKARTGEYLQVTFSLPSILYWTDSNTVIHCEKGLLSRWTEFVCNRVPEIKELTVPKNMPHRDGKIKTTDL